VEARPRIVEVLVVYSAVFAAIALLSYALLPAQAALAVVVIAAVVWLLNVSKAGFRYLTESYDVDSEYIGIKRGWFDKETALIPAANVAEVKAVRPLLLRLLSIGSVYVATTDGSTHVLYNVKHPESLVGAIRPAAAR
jgi:membrane protein YdbS with pleckstrin-like domain